MITYTKSITNDFGGNFVISQFHSEIIASGINTVFLGLNVIDNEILDIYFDTALTNVEIDILNILIQNHIPVNSKPKQKFFVVSANNNTSSKDYFRSISFKYQGSQNIGEIDYIEVTSYMDSGVEDYSIKIYDKTNNTIIGEINNLTNIEPSVIDVGPISNCPINGSLIEVQIKGKNPSSKKKVYIENIIVYYNN